MWQVSIEENSTYEIIVEAVNVTGQHDGVSIVVCSRALDFCSDEDTLASISTLSDGATLSFTASSVTTVSIQVVASIGENGESLGTFSLGIYKH